MCAKPLKIDSGNNYNGINYFFSDEKLMSRLYETPLIIVLAFIFINI